MTDSQRHNLKLKIIQEFKGLHYTLVEMFEILDDLKNEFSHLAIEQELRRLKIRRK